MRHPCGCDSTVGHTDACLEASRAETREARRQAADLDARLASAEIERDAAARAPVARPRSEWHEDDGPVLWWKLPVEEAPYAGDPREDDFPEEYYTHWTPIVCPECAHACAACALASKPGVPPTEKGTP